MAMPVCFTARKGLAVRLSLIFLFSAIVAPSALAEATPVLSALRAAVDHAAAHGDTRFAFTVAHWSEENGEANAIKMRFDPRLPAGAQWTLLDPLTETLTKQQKKTMEKYQESERPDAALVYDRLNDMMSDLTLREETVDEAVFAAPFREDGVPEGAVELTIIFDKQNNHVKTIALKSLKPFKPAPVAKISAMAQLQTFAPPRQDGPALLMQSETEVQGKAMLKSFSSQSRQTYIDIETVRLGDDASMPAASAPTLQR